MNQANAPELKELIDIYDESLRINKNELDKLENLVKGKPILRKLLFAQGGIQSSIQQYKNFMVEISLFNLDMMSKLCQFVYHTKQVGDRVEHISQFHSYQSDYQKFYKSFSHDVKICETALMKFLPEFSEIELLLEPLTDCPEDKAIEQVVKFNQQLNQKMTHLLHEFEQFKKTYLQLLQHKKTLEKLMHLCDIQQSI